MFNRRWRRLLVVAAVTLVSTLLLGFLEFGPNTMSTTESRHDRLAHRFLHLLGDGSDYLVEATANHVSISVNNQRQFVFVGMNHGSAASLVRQQSSTGVVTFGAKGAASWRFIISDADLETLQHNETISALIFSPCDSDTIIHLVNATHRWRDETLRNGDELPIIDAQTQSRLNALLHWLARVQQYSLRPPSHFPSSSSSSEPNQQQQQQQQLGLLWGRYAMQRWFLTAEKIEIFSLFVACPKCTPIDVAGNIPPDHSTHKWARDGPLFRAMKETMGNVTRLTLFHIDYRDFDYRFTVGEKVVAAALDDIPMLFMVHWNFYVDANGKLPHSRYLFVPDINFPIFAADDEEITCKHSVAEHRQPQLCADGIFNRSDLRDPSLRGCSVADVEQYGKQQLGRKRRAAFWRGSQWPGGHRLVSGLCDRQGHSRFATVRAANEAGRSNSSASGILDIDVGFSPCTACPDNPFCKPFVGGEPNATIVIDVDGFASSWAGLRRKLMSWAATIKIVSDQNFVQWYYPLLQDGVHLHLSEPTNVVDAARYIDSNPEYQLQLAVNAVRFAAEHLRPSAVRAYLFDAVSRAHENAEAVGRMKSWLIRPRQKPASGGVNVQQQIPWPKRLVATRNIVDDTVKMQPATLHCGDGLWYRSNLSTSSHRRYFTASMFVNVSATKNVAWSIVPTVLTHLPIRDEHIVAKQLTTLQQLRDREEEVHCMRIDLRLPFNRLMWMCPLARATMHPMVYKVLIEV